MKAVRSKIFKQGDCVSLQVYLDCYKLISYSFYTIVVYVISIDFGFWNCLVWALQIIDIRFINLQGLWRFFFIFARAAMVSSHGI